MNSVCRHSESFVIKMLRSFFVRASNADTITESLLVPLIELIIAVVGICSKIEVIRARGNIQYFRPTQFISRSVELWPPSLLSPSLFQLRYCAVLIDAILMKFSCQNPRAIAAPSSVIWIIPLFCSTTFTLALLLIVSIHNNILLLFAE